MEGSAALTVLHHWLSSINWAKNIFEYMDEFIEGKAIKLPEKKRGPYLSC